jgi:hypothetical protein
MKTITLLSLFFFGYLLPSGEVRHIAYWSHSGKDVNGNPENLVRAEYIVLHASGTAASQAKARLEVDLSVSWIESITAAITSFPLEAQSAILQATRADNVTALLAGLPSGTYKLWVRVQDAAGNWSAYTSSNYIDLTAPKPPSAVEVK